MAKGKRKKSRMGSWPPPERRWASLGSCDVLDPEVDPESPFEFGYRIPHPTCHHWRQPVEIVYGVTVYASAYTHRPRTSEWEWPEIGVYLSERWVEDVPLASFHWAGPVLGPSAQIVVLPCPDGGCPLYEEETERVFAYALNAARAGRFVEVGCHAGHGRTGMALAALMIVAGFDAVTAMLKVWNDYCEQAIETVGQERYLLDLEQERKSDGHQLGESFTRS